MRFALALVAALSGPAMAQPASVDTSRAAAERIVGIAHGQDWGADWLTGMLAEIILEPHLSNANPGKETAVADAARDLAPSLAAWVGPNLRSRLIDHYLAAFSATELETIAAFLDTAVGARFLKAWSTTGLTIASERINETVISEFLATRRDVLTARGLKD